MLGAQVSGDHTRFSVHAPFAQAVWLCLFQGEDEQRHTMVREGENWALTLDGNWAGARYGYRAAGAWAPDEGMWFDPAKLLVDPYAVELDRRFVQSPILAQFGADTAAIVPKAIVPSPDQTFELPPVHDPRGGLIYEVNVKAFTILHPDVPENIRGTIAALAHPAVLAHLQKLSVAAVELMPIVAWVDERHLPPLGLVNAWGYNPVAMMALDPGLCPGGVGELRDTVAALHAQGIGVILDMVFNHSGESDREGGILSLRGFDDRYYAKAPDGTLINDTGCGNTLDFGNPAVRNLALASMRHFVRQCGVDGFRFDLATIMARSPAFDPQAPIFAEIAQDPWLSDRIMIAEPWDIGPGGYQVGQFPAHWLEWNDCFRDDLRQFWRGDGSIGTLATRLAGSTNMFGPISPDYGCRSLNFLAAHDGMTLADTVAYASRHNEANGENNRDGHGENHSWNYGIEGPTADAHILALRQADVKAMLQCLFASTGTIMLTAGDEFSRSQQGNNNAYCQDNALTWLDWAGRDCALEEFVARLSAQRQQRGREALYFSDYARWLNRDGSAMSVSDWERMGVGYLCCEQGAGARTLRVEIDRDAKRVSIEYGR